MSNADTDDWGRIDHPAPRRGQVSLFLIGFGVLGAPLVWSGQLLANNVLAGQACFGKAAIGGISAETALWSIIIVGIVALVVSFAAGLVSYRSWRITRDEHAGSAEPLLEIGEGRTRFLAVVGLVFSGGFFAAIVFNLIGWFMVPLCAS